MRPILPTIAVLLVVLAGCAAPVGVDPASIDTAGFSTSASSSGAYDMTGPFSRVLERGPFGILPDEVVELESTMDGVAIQFAVVRPDVPEGTRVPIIAWISPYVADLASVRVADQDGDSDGNNGVAGAFLVENFVPHGYAVAAIAVRGSAGSGGCLDWLGADERADVLQAIDWLVGQPWSSGAIGAYGLSYEAGTQWALAASGHPAVKTIVPVNGPNDLWAATARNGTVNTGILLVEPVVTALNTIDDRAPAQIAGTACSAFVERRPGAAQAFLTGERGLAAHVFDDRAFRRPIEENYRGSILVVQGFQDPNIFPRNSYPWASTLEDDGIVVKHLLGAWEHTIPDGPGVATPRYDLAEKLLRWYDHWLKGDETSELGPIVEVVDTELRWRSESAWPPADAAPRKFYLTPGGALADTPASSTERVLVGPEPTTAVLPISGLVHEGVPDAPSIACETCVLFSTDELDHELRFAGLAQVHLTVVPAGPGGYLAARLCAQGPDGSRILTQGVMDLRFAGGGVEPRDVVPGSRLLARLELEPADVVVPAGSRLVLEVSQGGYGSQYFYHGTRSAYPFDVEVGGDGSIVRILTFERAPDDLRFFEPPGDAR